MAQTASSSETPAPRGELYDAPWRKHDTTYEELVKEISDIKPAFVANLLLLGPTGAGKSSTVNSIVSLAKGRRANVAYTGTKDTSFTTKFKPKTPLSKDDPCFRKKPSIEEQIHCVVLVFDSNTMKADIIGPYIEKIKEFQNGVQGLDIPCVLVLPKIDQLCSKVREDITKTFYSTKVHDAFKTATEIFGIPEGNIHPLKNYEVEINLCKETSILILLAVRQALHFASDRIDKLKMDEGCTVC